MTEFKVPDNLSQIMKDRYYQEGENKPQEIFRRVAKFIAEGEEQYGWVKEERKDLENQYFHMMNENLFMPSSPFLMNAGTRVPMVFACFLVGGLEDDLESIYEGVKRQGIINKQGGTQLICHPM